MTVSASSLPITYSGNGSTTVFPYSFKILANADIHVSLKDTSTGVITVQTLTTHYTVSGAGSASGGNVTFLTAPASGKTVILTRGMTIEQQTDYNEYDAFPAATHETALDRAAMISQQQQEEIDRSLKVDSAVLASGFSAEIVGTPVAGNTLVVNTDADGLQFATATDLGTYNMPVGTGVLVQTASGTATVRTLTAGSGITITDGDGVAGNPTIAASASSEPADNVFRVVDNADATKKLAFECSGITTATTRTITVPNASGTMALTSDITTEFTDSTFTIGDGGDSTKKVAFQCSGITTATTRTLTVPNASGTIALTSDIGSIPSAATQAEQETASSTTVYVSPGRQQYHPSAAKCWGFCTVSVGVPTLQTNHNITSITDTGTGVLTVTINVDHSSTNYFAHSQVHNNGTLQLGIQRSGKAVGSFVCESYSTVFALQDPAEWSFITFGDQ